MNNPNHDYHCAGRGPDLDPALDPDYNWWPWLMAIDYRVGHEYLRHGAICRWLEAAGFSDIQVILVPERGPESWQIIMRRGLDQVPPTVREIERQMCALAVDLGLSAEGASLRPGLGRQHRCGTPVDSARTGMTLRPVWVEAMQPV